MWLVWSDGCATWSSWSAQHIRTPRALDGGLEDSLRSLEQLDRKIDIFKIDIEGAEFDVLTPILQKPSNYLARNVRQVLVEVHDKLGESRKPPPVLHTLMAAFLESGFHVYHKEPNTFGCYGRCLEIALVRLELPPSRDAKPVTSFRGVKSDSGPAKLRQLIFERQMLHQSMQPGDGWFPMGDTTGLSKAAVKPKYHMLLGQYARRGQVVFLFMRSCRDA